MARRSVTGQLNMFELLNNLEEMSVGEVEMVSLMPVFDEETDEIAEIEEGRRSKANQKAKPTAKAEVIHKEGLQQEETKQNETDFEAEEHEEIEEQEPSRNADVELQGLNRDADKPVMSRSYEVNGESIEVAYLNYNKVRITRAGMEPEIKVFDSTKEAVDYYVQIMQEWEKDEE